MGVSDKLWFRLVCPKCGASETLSVLDYGSTWSGPAWGNLGDAERFDLDATKSGGEPEVKGAICKVCGIAASIESEYGFKCPEGW